MITQKSFTEEFKHSVLEYIYKDEDNANILCTAEQHFCAQGHSITKQSIHSWQLKHDKIYICARRLKDYLEEGLNQYNIF